MSWLMILWGRTFGEKCSMINRWMWSGWYVSASGQGNDSIYCLDSLYRLITIGIVKLTDFWFCCLIVFIFLVSAHRFLSTLFVNSSHVSSKNHIVLICKNSVVKVPWVSYFLRSDFITYIQQWEICTHQWGHGNFCLSKNFIHFLIRKKLWLLGLLVLILRSEICSCLLENWNFLPSNCFDLWFRPPSQIF